MAKVSFTETIKWSDIEVSADQLIDLFREHAPDAFEEAVGIALITKLTEEAPYDKDTYGPIIEKLRDLAREQYIEPELDDIVSVEES